MPDVKCKTCDVTATYNGAALSSHLDACGVEVTPENLEDGSYGGGKHDWEEL